MIGIPRLERLDSSKILSFVVMLKDYFGQIIGLRGIDKLPVEPFSTFWDEDFFIEHLRDIIKVSHLRRIQLFYLILVTLRLPKQCRGTFSLIPLIMECLWSLLE